MQIGDIISFEECKLCGNIERKIIAAKDKNNNPLTSVICIGCGLIHTYPVPSQQELDSYYSSYFDPEYSKAFEPRKKHLIRRSKKAARRIRKLMSFIKPEDKPHQMLLDIGSGSGEFIYFANLAGFITTGLEPNQGYANFIREHLNLNIVNASFENTNFLPESFDIVTMHNVLGFMRKPFDVLCSINKILKKGGIIEVDTPDIEVQMHAPNRRFNHDNIYSFNHETLKWLLFKAGFEQLNEEKDKSTIIVARKVREPRPKVTFPMIENYQKLWSTLTNYNSAKHYVTATPYIKFFDKVKNYPKEILKSLTPRSKKSILDNKYKKYVSEN